MNSFNIRENIQNQSTLIPKIQSWVYLQKILPRLGFSNVEKYLINVSIKLRLVA